MSLNDLSTAPIHDDVDFANLPEQRQEFAPPPQPGPKRFRLSKLGPDNFDAVDGGEYGPRARVKFDGNAPLVITQSTEPSEVNTPFQTQLSNVPRRRGKGEDAPKSSDWDYLNKALKEAQRPTTAFEYAQKLMVHANQAEEFGADIEWSVHCNPKREAQWMGEDGALHGGTDAAGQVAMGCGARVYQREIPKLNGKFQERMTCPKCSASLRAFANLTRFRE